MNIPGSVAAVGVGFPITIPAAFEAADLDIPEVIGSGPKRVPRPITENNVTQKPDASILSIFVIGALIFIVIFAWFNIIQLLINTFYESLYKSSNDKATRRDFHIALIKQVTFAFIVTLILWIYFRYYFGN